MLLILALLLTHYTVTAFATRGDDEACAVQLVQCMATIDENQTTFMNRYIGSEDNHCQKLGWCRDQTDSSFLSSPFLSLMVFSLIYVYGLYKNREHQN